MKVLAGDIGGSNTRLAVFAAEGEGLETVVEETYRSREHDSLQEIVEIFLRRYGEECAAASFGIAGPVREGRVKTTNLPWVVEASSIAERTGIGRVSLLNDLEANAHGVDALGPEDFFVLADRQPAAHGNRALVSAGTGLGEAGMVWQAGRYRPFASEGGHTDFAPGSDLEIALLQFLWKRCGRHVSWERVISGPGLVTLFEFLREHQRYEPPAWLEEEMEDSDPAAAITRAAQAERSEICIETLKLFVGLYGAEAGNLALTVLATGGVYLGGGIAPKILDALQGPGFLEAFHAKGRMRPLLESMPIRVILNERTALLGAARHAVLQVEEA